MTAEQGGLIFIIILVTVGTMSRRRESAEVWSLDQRNRRILFLWWKVVNAKMQYGLSRWILMASSTWRSWETLEVGPETFRRQNKKDSAANWVWIRTWRVHEAASLSGLPEANILLGSGGRCIFLTVIWNPIICLPQVQTALLSTQNNYTMYGLRFDFSIRSYADAIATFARKVTASVV